MDQQNGRGIATIQVIPTRIIHALRTIRMRIMKVQNELCRTEKASGKPTDA
jgi:hypothetical protein